MEIILIVVDREMKQVSWLRVNLQQQVDQIEIHLWSYECSPWLLKHVSSPPGEAWQYGAVFSTVTTTKVGEYGTNYVELFYIAIEVSPPSLTELIDQSIFYPISYHWAVCPSFGPM